MAAPEAISWSDWPAPRLGLRALLAGLVIVVVGVAATLMQPIAGLVAAALMLSASGEALLPTTYTLSADGLHIRRLLGNQEVRWEELHRWRAASGGFILFWPARSRWRRSRRPVVLRCPGREDEVRSWLISKLGFPEGAP